MVVLDKPEAGRFMARKLTDYSLGIYASAAYLKARKLLATLDLIGHRLIGYVEEHAFFKRAQLCVKRCARSGY